ncbi:TPA: hypothetical protein EYP38_01285 [Candidatus Micrarchaeota archaeon]|nr:hypothetical protein [Candidatus Micrarchaeota archaeon]
MMGVLGFLKPTKQKLIGTAILLFSDFLAGAIAGQAGRILIPPDAFSELTPAFQEAMAASIGSILLVGTIMIILEWGLKLAFYYSVLAFTIDRIR